MHVALVSAARGIPLYGPSGASAHLRGVANALCRRGLKVTVVVPSLSDARGQLEATCLATVVCVPPGPLPRRRAARELAELRHSHRLAQAIPSDVDLVWERHSLHAPGPAWWCSRHQVPRWLEVNAPLSVERSLTDPVGLPRVARHAERYSIRTAERCLVVSRWLDAWVRAAGATRVTHLANGTQLESRDREAGRAALGVRGPIMGFVGSCRQWHRLERLQSLLEALPDWHALVVGDGDACPSHPRLLRRRATADPGDLIAAMDVGLVLGGLPWMHPLKVSDYRSQGVPIVAVPVGDTRLAVADGGTVLPWGPEWPHALQQAIDSPRRPHLRPWDEVVDEAFSRP